MHNKVFGARSFDTTECSHLQGSKCLSREDASQDIWLPTFRRNLIFSSSRVGLPKKRRCITIYLFPDVSTQRNVLIFKGRAAQAEKRHHKIFGCRRFDTTNCSHLQPLRYPRRIFVGDEYMTNTLSQNSKNQIPSGAAPHPTSPPRLNPKNLQILRNSTLFYTIKEKSPAINLRC